MSSLEKVLEQARLLKSDQVNELMYWLIKEHFKPGVSELLINNPDTRDVFAWVSVVPAARDVPKAEFEEIFNNLNFQPPASADELS